MKNKALKNDKRGGVKMKYMIAGSYQDYLDTLQNWNKNPKHWMYVSQPQQLYGKYNIKVYHGFNAHLNPAWEIAQRINKGVYYGEV